MNGDLGQPQPVYLHRGNYVVPTGNTGIINLNTGEQVYIACTGSGRTIQHPNIATSTATGVSDLKRQISNNFLCSYFDVATNSCINFVIDGQLCQW